MYRRRKKILFTNRGSIIDKGAIYVVVILTLLIFGAFIFVGGTLPTKLPKPNTDLVNLTPPKIEPTKTGLQLYTFSGVTLTPTPTRPPPPLSFPILKSIGCGRQIIGKQEPSMIWGYTLDSTQASGNELALKVFFTNKHALLLGVGNISPLGKSPSHISTPLLGDTTIRDIDNFPIHPAIFATDITTHTTNISGDAQSGGQPNTPDTVYGAWKAAGAPDPVANGMSRTPLSDPWPPANGPPGTHASDFTAELVWKLSNVRARDPVSNQYLAPQPGHKYRVQIALHDGEDPTDVGVACLEFTMPGGSGTPIAACFKSSVPPRASSGNSFTSTRTISNANGLVIDGDTYTISGGDCLVIRNSSNITVRNSTFTKCGMNGIVIVNSSDITIEGNTISGVGPPPTVDSRSGRGIYFQGLDKTSNVKIRNNIIKGPVHSSCIQFNGVQGSGHEISNNQCIDVGLNTVGFVPDIINLYHSSGTAASPIRVVGNYIRNNGHHYSACGIQTADHDTNYVHIQYNTLINTGGWGLCTAGNGHDSAALDNLVFMDQIWTTDVIGRNGAAIAVGARETLVPCYNITIRNNFAKTINRARLYQIHDGGNPSNTIDGECTPITGFSGNTQSVNGAFGYHRHTSTSKDTNHWNDSTVASITANSCLCQSNCPAGTTVVDLIGSNTGTP
jgi:parallel beta-helix repeat protein